MEPLCSKTHTHYGKECWCSLNVQSSKGSHAEKVPHVLFISASIDWSNKASEKTFVTKINLFKINLSKQSWKVCVKRCQTFWEKIIVAQMSQTFFLTNDVVGNSIPCSRKTQEASEACAAFDSRCLPTLINSTSSHTVSAWPTRGDWCV